MIFLQFSDNMNHTGIGVKVTRVHAKKGSLILWDSRLPHHAVPPVEGNMLFMERVVGLLSVQRSGRARFCIYVCMVPRRLGTEKRRQGT